MKQKILFISILFYTGITTITAYGATADQVTIASVQYLIEGEQTQESMFKKIEDYVKQASEQKANIVLFPEWVTLDTWPTDKKKTDSQIVISVAKEITQNYLNFLKSLSKKYNVVIAGGSTAKKQNGKIYNSAVIVFPDGKLIEHKKVYLTKWERENGVSAGSKPTVFDTPWGRMAILICYDVEFPDISVDLAKEQFDVLLVPSMTESEQGLKRVRWTAQSRAVELTSYVVISSTVGNVSKDWVHFGQAAFLTPQLPGLKGVISEGVLAKSGVWTDVLDLKKLRELKKSSSWTPSKQIRKR